MRELQQRQKFKRRLYSTPALLALLVVTILIARGTYSVWQKKVSSQAYVTSLEAKVAELNTEEVDVTQNMASLGTESGIEKEVKEKYNVAKEGEHVVILVDPTPTTTQEVGPEKSWFRRAWSAIISAL